MIGFVRSLNKYLIAVLFDFSGTSGIPEKSISHLHAPFRKD